jgi:preprotein translocase subunit SecE
VSDEGNAANDAAREDDRESGGHTAVVTEPVTRPQRPTGKRSRQRSADPADRADAESLSESDEADGDESDEGEDGRTSATKAKTRKKAKTGKTPVKERPANPFVFIYNYLKQVVAEMRKVIWPSRKQMLTYTSVVLVFLAIMVTVVGVADFGLAKLILLVFG